MARSQYVYAVMTPGQIAPLATFTVKYEMARMLRNVRHDAPSVLAQLKVYRMDDGPGGMVAEMSVAEILEG
jgi:hypothetical protein